MKVEFNEYMKNAMSNWNAKTYKAILEHDWPKVKHLYAETPIGVDVPEDIRISLLTLFGDDIEKKIHTKASDRFICDNSIYDLLTGTSKDGYSLKEGQDLVRWYIMNYWDFINR